MRELTRRAAPPLLGGAALALLVGLASGAHAQDALIPPPEGMTRGSTQLTSYSVLVPRDDDEVGFFLRGALGVNEDLSVRASLGLYNDLTYLSAAGDLLLPRMLPVDLLVSLGFHRSGFEQGADILGADLALVGRHALGTKSAVYGGLDFDFEMPEDPYDTFTRARFVAGVNTALTSTIGVLVEGGLGFNDQSPHYLSAGLTVRLR